MRAKARILNLYTLYYPQGAYEAFLEPEIPYLAAAFDEVHVYPWSEVKEPSRKLPDNVKVIYSAGVLGKSSLTERWRLLRTNLSKKAYLSSLRYQLAHTGALAQRADVIEQQLAGQGQQVLHYSYWFDEWATVLGLLAERGTIASYVCRAHGFDLYDERQAMGYHPYRSVQQSGLARLYPVSRVGEDYLRSRLPKAPLQTAYLGTDDHGLGPRPAGDVLRVISIARLVPLKRISLVFESVAQCKRPIHWTHIGDGPEMMMLKPLLQSLPKHVTVEFKGHMPHEQVMALYQKQAFHLFLSLSSSEGLPVSMMEAISFGVPILSTAVGGVAELVQASTGLLVDENPAAADIAAILDDVLLSGLVSEEFRLSVRQFWQAHFDASSNYPAFIADIRNVLEMQASS